MKLPYSKFIKILLIFLVLSNCSYEFSEDSFMEITQKPPTAIINLNDLSNNQIFYVPTAINFSYTGNNKHLLYEIKIHIDNTLIKTSIINSGDFTIDTEILENGNHALKIEYIFSSGSGSLADISGVESYIKTEEYNFIVDKSLPETVIMKSVEIIDGSIYLSWEAVTKTNFDSARLIITNNGSQSGFEITKQELLNLTYNDTYVHTFTPAGGGQTGHDLEYQIYLKNTRGNTTSNKVGLFIEPFEIEKLILNENQYKLIIPQHTLYNNFNYYAFNDNYNNTPHKVSSHGGEIVVDEPIIFPNYNGGVSLTLYSESDGEDISKGTIFILKSYNKQFDYHGGSQYTDYQYNKYDDFIYVLRNGSSRSPGNYITLEKLDPDDLSSVDSKDIAPYGQYLAETLTIDSITKNLIVDAGNISFLIDKNTLSIIKQWELSEFGEQLGYIFYRNDIIIIEKDDEISFYDSNTKTQFYTVNKTGYFKISENGKYFFANNTIFEINNKSVSAITTTNTNDSVNVIQFIEDLNKCIYNSYDGNPIIFDLVTRTKSTLSDFTRINIIDYDSNSKKILLVRSEFGINDPQASYAYVYDLVTTNFKKIEVEDVVSYWRPNDTPRGYWFAKDKLINRNGFYLDHYLNQ